MATLATSILAARAQVPGSNTTNTPDASFLIWANNIYPWLAFQDHPRILKWAGGTGGVTTVASSREAATNVANFSRLLAVKYEGLDNSTSVGPPLEYLTKDAYELEVANFPGTTGRPRCYHAYRQSGSGTWIVLLHPLPDAEYYLSVEGEPEPSALSSVSSTVLLSSSLIAQFDKMLAYVAARNLDRDQSFLDNLLADMPDRKIMDRWLAREQERGETMSGESRGRRG